MRNLFQTDCTLDKICLHAKSSRCGHTDTGPRPFGFIGYNSFGFVPNGEPVDEMVGGKRWKVPYFVLAERYLDSFAFVGVDE